MNEDKKTQVTIYSTPTCHYCHMAKAYFGDKGIEYTEYDVSVDHEKRQEMVEKTGQLGVPVIEINGKTTIGFDKTAVEAMLSA